MKKVKAPKEKSGPNYKGGKTDCTPNTSKLLKTYSKCGHSGKEKY